MSMSVPAGLNPLPVPPHYMRAAERHQLLEMTRPIGRPDGDHRSAASIIELSSVATQFLDSRDHYEVADNLKRHVGDWTHANSDPEARANAAYDLDKVLRFIDNVDDRRLSDSESRNGLIDGFRNHGYSSLDNSEARLLSQFAQHGYEVLRQL